MGQYQKDRFGWAKGQSDLVLRKDGKWFLLVTVDVPDGTPTPTTDFIGVDLGVVNIAVDSDGKVHSSNKVEAKRVLRFSQRKAMGKKTKDSTRSVRHSCRKAMKRLGSKESRYRTDVNHQISKELVVKAKGTNRGIALEDLKGIRDRTQFRKQQRARMGSWAFSQLRLFIEYKAKLAGVSVVVVDPRNTSRTCSSCGHCEKANRKTQEKFKCCECGFELLADLNGARNVRARALVNVPIESEQRHTSAA